MDTKPRNVYPNPLETLNEVPSSLCPAQDWIGQSEEFLDISYTSQSPSEEAYSSNDLDPWSFVSGRYRTSPERLARVTSQTTFNLESGNGRYASIHSTVREEGRPPSALSNNAPNKWVGGSQTSCSTNHREKHSEQLLLPPTQHRTRRQSHSLHNKLMKRKHTAQRMTSNTNLCSKRNPDRPDVIQFIPKGGESLIHCARYSKQKMARLRVGDLRRNIAVIRKLVDHRRIQLSTSKLFLSDDNIYVMPLGTRMVYYWISDIIALDGQFNGRMVPTWLDFPPNSFDQNLVSIGAIRKRVLLYLEGLVPPEEPHSVQQNLELLINGVPLRDDSHGAGHSGLRTQAINKLAFVLTPILQGDTGHDVQTRACIACTDELPPPAFPITITAKCQHEIKSCTSCLQAWIESQINGGGLEAIKCMECLQPLLYEDVKRNASRWVFQRYDKLVTREMLNSIPNFRWCLRPGCEAGQIHDINEDSPIFICCDTTCGYKFCVNHSIPWHEDETCAEYDYRTVGKFKDDAASEESIKKLCKRCAKCESPIEKHKGCDHMTCFKCKYEFCWICLVPWDNIRERDDAGHESHCKNYRAPRQRPGVPPLIPPPNQNGRVYEMPAPNFEGYGMRTPGEYARDPYLIREPGRDRVGGPDAELNQIRMRVRERSRETYHRNRH